MGRGSAGAALSLCFLPGPSDDPGQTARLLSDLGVRATFYVEPQYALGRLASYRAAFELGHEMGNGALALMLDSLGAVQGLDPGGCRTAIELGDEFLHEVFPEQGQASIYGPTEGLGTVGIRDRVTVCPGRVANLMASLTTLALQASRLDSQTGFDHSPPSAGEWRITLAPASMSGNELSAVGRALAAWGDAVVCDSVIEVAQRLPFLRRHIAEQ